MIDHDRKLREFMSRKDHERTEAHEEMEAMRRKKGTHMHMYMHMYMYMHNIGNFVTVPIVLPRGEYRGWPSLHPGLISFHWNAIGF